MAATCSAIAKLVACLDEEADLAGGDRFGVLLRSVKVSIASKATLGEQSPVESHERLKLALGIQVDEHVDTFSPLFSLLASSERPTGGLRLAFATRHPLTACESTNSGWLVESQLLAATDDLHLMELEMKLRISSNAMAVCLSGFVAAALAS